MYFAHILIPHYNQAIFSLFVNVSGPLTTKKEGKCGNKDQQLWKNNLYRQAGYKEQTHLFILLGVYFHLLFSCVQHLTIIYFLTCFHSDYICFTHTHTQFNKTGLVEDGRFQYPLKYSIQYRYIGNPSRVYLE